MAAEGEFPKVDGDILFASEVNYLNNGKVQQVYTGSGFDSTQVTSAGTPDEQSHELTAVTNAKGATRVRISVVYENSITTGNSFRSISFKAEIKEIGGSYVSAVTEIKLHDPTTIESGSGVNMVSFLIDITAGMRTNGFQIKLFSKSDVGGTGTVTFENIETVEELV